MVGKISISVMIVGTFVLLVAFMIISGIFDTLIHNINVLYTKHCIKNYVNGDMYALYIKAKKSAHELEYKWTMYNDILGDKFWHEISASKVLDVITFIFNIKVMNGLWKPVEHPVISAKPTKQEYLDAICAYESFCCHFPCVMLTNYPDVLKLIWEDYFGYSMEFAMKYRQDVDGNWFTGNLINYYTKCDQEQLQKK